MTTTPQPMDDARWELLGRFIAGECSAHETEAVERWLAGDPARRQLVSSLNATLGRLGSDTSDVDTEGALLAVRARFGEAEVRALPIPERPVRAWRTTPFRIAAAVVLLLAAVLVWRGMQANGAAGASWTTAAGETESVQLPDGSAVLLGPLSRLSAADGYGAGRRALELEGEALFDVMHRPGQPFIVQAGSAVVEDLGTTFTVRSVADQPVEVVVTQGAVRLRAAASSVDDGAVLNEGDLGLLDAAGNVTTRSGSTAEDALAWTSGRLVFVDAPLARVRADLQRWYGIDVQVADSALSRRHVTATFEEETIDQILEVLGLVLGARVERQGETVTLHALDTETPPR